MMKTAIVLINYYKEHELVLFVNKFLLAQLNESRHLYIVDNGSSSDALKQAFAAHEHISLLFPNENLGYFGAANMAYEFMSGNHIDPEFFIISNFDLEFNERSFLNDLEINCSKLDVGVIGPAIQSSLSYTELNPMYPSRLSSGKINLLLFITSFYPFFLTYQWLHHMKRRFFKGSMKSSPSSGLVYAVHGSFMIFTRKYFRSGGHLRFGSFLYGEELFVAEECLKSGCGLYFEASIKMKHHEHSTTGVYKTAAHMKWLHRSISYIHTTYYGK
jgi:GT2 family glycosyltransferase